MDLLEEIARQGWSERCAQEFERSYGETIRWRILVYMEKLGFIQEKLHPERIGLLSDRRLELYQNTLSDLWIRLLEGLVGHFVNGKKAGRIHTEFPAYLSGVIKKVLLDNARELGLLPEETPYELLLSVCEAKRGQSSRVAWAKYCFGESVRHEVLNRCPKPKFTQTYKNIHHVVDYFFEIFVPNHPELVRRARRRTVAQLVQAFLDRELDNALTYIGQITPYAAQPKSVGLQFQTPEEAEDEDEFLSFLHQEVEGLA